MAHKKDHDPEHHIRTHMIYTNRDTSRFSMMGAIIELPKNHSLQEAGNLPDSAYFIERGRIASYEYSPDGREYFYNINEEGTLLFESAIILGRKLTLNYKTLTPAMLVKIPRKVLLEAVVSDPEVTMDLLYMVSEKFLEVNAQIREESNHSASWKVCNLLLSYASHYGAEYDGKVLIQEKVSLQQIANTLRINRVTVTRALKKLRDSGHVEQINGFLCIRNPYKLRAHMDFIDELGDP